MRRFPGLAYSILAARLALALPLLFQQEARAQAYGIDSRAANTTLLINDIPAAATSMTLVRVFPTASFDQPVYMTEIPDGSGRLVVLEKMGQIKVFSKNVANPTPTVMLDLTSKVQTDSEQGLLGIAFDPNFATSGNVYVYYVFNSGDPGTSRLVRYHMANPAANTIDASTEQILLTQAQPESNHNGGTIAFGPDGMLYWGLGDGGGGGDQHGTIGNGQNTSVLLAKIMRIDVRGTPDSGLAYRIPTDNPFYNTAGFRKEIWAYGVRNPYRFSFDMVNGRLWIGDVGQDQVEEIDIGVAGANYGWRLKEGNQCYNPSTNCDIPGLTGPIFTYPHNGSSKSITGGCVYYGSAVPQLYGLYVYGDFETGEIWALKYADGAVQSNSLLLNSGRNPSCFAQDLSGEVYVVDYSGGLYKFQPSVATSSNFPNKLSDIPSLLAAGKGQDQTAQGVIPYEPSAKLWSDNAGKSRFMALPGTAQIGYRAAQGWDFPDGTVLIKNFSLPLDERTPTTSSQRIETRLLFRKHNQWNGFSYLWNDDQSDAQLLTDAYSRSFVLTNSSGHLFGYTWHYPSRSECLQCHTNAANGVLGLTTPQLNFDFKYSGTGVTDNQLRTLDHIGMFSAALPGAPNTLPQMPDYNNTSASLHDRARAYLASNCAMCHQPGGTAPTNMDFRWETTDGNMHALSVLPSAGTLAIPFARIIYPGSANNSVVANRMGRRDSSQMPPLDSTRVDAAGVELIRDWINALPAQNAALGWESYR